MPVKIALSVACFIMVARVAWAQEREYLVQAHAGLRDAPAGRLLASELEDDAVTSAAGTRAQRRRGLKEARKAGGRKQKKALVRRRVGYLDALQAWGRRGTGVDELPAAPWDGAQPGRESAR